MRTIEFKLPKTLHSGDVFKQELKPEEPETWYGFNYRIVALDRNEYYKLIHNTAFIFYPGTRPTALELKLPLGVIPSDDRIFRGEDSKWLNEPQSFYDISVISEKGRIPLAIYKQESCNFELLIQFEDKKYIKFKKEPIILINIFNKQKESK